MLWILKAFHSLKICRWPPALFQGLLKQLLVPQELLRTSFPIVPYFRSRTLSRLMPKQSSPQRCLRNAFRQHLRVSPKCCFSNLSDFLERKSQRGWREGDINLVTRRQNTGVRDDNLLSFTSDNMISTSRRVNILQLDGLFGFY